MTADEVMTYCTELEGRLSYTEHNLVDLNAAIACKADQAAVDSLAIECTPLIGWANDTSRTGSIDLSDICDRLEALEEAVRRLQQPSPETLNKLL